MCVTAGTVNAGGLCSGELAFVLNAEYHADKPQSFTCNRVNGEVQLESRDLLQKQLVPYHSTFLKGSDPISVLTLFWDECVRSVDSQQCVSPVLNLVYRL